MTTFQFIYSLIAYMAMASLIITFLAWFVWSVKTLIKKK